MSYASILRYSESHDLNITEILDKAVSGEIKLFGYVSSATIVHYPALYDTPIMEGLSKAEYRKEERERLPVRATLQDEYVQLMPRYIDACIFGNCSSGVIGFLINGKKYTTQLRNTGGIGRHFTDADVCIVDNSKVVNPHRQPQWEELRKGKREVGLFIVDVMESAWKKDEVLPQSVNDLIKMIPSEDQRKFSRKKLTQVSEFIFSLKNL